MCIDFIIINNISIVYDNFVILLCCNIYFKIEVEVIFYIMK